MTVEWVTFPKGWCSWWKARTGKPFTWRHVNGNCAYVANLYRKFIQKGENQYGFFHGTVTHPYWKKSEFIRHGWLLIRERWESHIVDPTRWCFHLDQKPLLAIAPVDSPDYDMGMRKVRLAMEGPMPAYNPKKRIACNCAPILRIFGDLVSLDRIFWLANLQPGSTHFKNEKERVKCFRWLQDNGHAIFIPIDNRV